jgi:hypothetical protein
MNKTKPLPIVKPDRELNTYETSDFHDTFGENYILRIINNDSMRILNKWIQSHLLSCSYITLVTGCNGINLFAN